MAVSKLYAVFATALDLVRIALPLQRRLRVARERDLQHDVVAVVEDGTLGEARRYLDLG